MCVPSEKQILMAILHMNAGIQGSAWKPPLAQVGQTGWQAVAGLLRDTMLGGEGGQCCILLCLGKASDTSVPARAANTTSVSQGKGLRRSETIPCPYTGSVTSISFLMVACLT